MKTLTSSGGALNLALFEVLRNTVKNINDKINVELEPSRVICRLASGWGFDSLTLVY